MIGKSEMIRLMMITDFSSNPNHNTISGATATTGTVYKRIAYGYKLRSMIFDKLMTVATVIPSVIARM